MLHPEIMRLLADEKRASLQNAARRIPADRRPAPGVDPAEIELRLCRVDDDPALERLAALDEKVLACGRFLVAIVNGKIAAALPLVAGDFLADPFVRTAHLERLLRVRAAQLGRREPRRALVWRYASLMRGSTHA